jgi:hypothetical protein
MLLLLWLLRDASCMSSASDAATKIAFRFVATYTAVRSALHTTCFTKDLK